MKLWLVRIVVLIASALTPIIIGSFFLPSEWEVTRSIEIYAPPERIFVMIANLQTWPKWSHFDKEDPDIKYSYSGTPVGVGAKRAWVSKKMGDGVQLITRAAPKKGIEFELEMLNTGYKLKGKLEFAVNSVFTKVTWKDWGVVGYNPVYRWMSFYMDNFMGEAFERSLENLKTAAEAAVSN